MRFRALLASLFSLLMSALTAQQPAPLVAEATLATAEAGSSKAAPAPLNAPAALTGEEPDVVAWIASRLRYPDLAREYGVEGEVTVSYRVEADGRMTDITITRGLGFGCDEAVLALFASLPAWSPARENGVAVARRVTTPVSFRLQ